MNMRKLITHLAQRFSRITTSGKYMPLVDGLRFLAIAPVIVQHLSERLVQHSPVAFATPVREDQLVFLASRGTIGVFIFFALSGFMLSLPFAKHHPEGSEKPSLKGYFLRRFTRIEPPYLVWISVFALVLMAKGAYSFGEMFPHWLASCFYLHNIVYGEYSVINPVAWSLEIEIQFYLIAPFLVGLIFSIRQAALRQWVLWGSILGYVSLQHALGWQFFPCKATLLGQLQHFLVGIWLADCYLTRWSKGVAGSYRWDLLFVPALLVMAYTWTEEYWKSLVFTLALAYVLAAAFKGRFFQKFLCLRWIAITGGMCYTIYLIHLPLMELQMRFTKNLTLTNYYLINLLVQAAIAIPLILAVSAFFFVFLEKPFMRKDWLPALLASAKGWTSKVFSPKMQPRPAPALAVSWHQKVIVKMKKIAAPFFFFFLLMSTQSSAQDVSFAEEFPLPSLDSLIALAIQKSPVLRSQDVWIENRRLDWEVKRRGWADLVTIGGAALLGSNNLLDYSTTTTGAEQTTVNRFNTGYNAGISLRFSLGDVLNRGDKSDLARLEYERAQVDKESIERQLREEVMRRYDTFNSSLRILKLDAQNVEAMGLALEMAEKYFREANLPVSEYTNVLSKKISADKQFEEAKLEAQHAYRMLREIAGL
jgi:peptidoglycan/LPS O-acetylase OafA/YrhL